MFNPAFKTLKHVIEDTAKSVKGPSFYFGQVDLMTISIYRTSGAQKLLFNFAFKSSSMIGLISQI